MKKLITIIVSLFFLNSANAEWQDNSTQKIDDLEVKLNEVKLKHYNWEEIIDVSNKILKLAADHPEAHFEKAKALLALGKYQEAISSFDEVQRSFIMIIQYPHDRDYDNDISKYAYYYAGQCSEQLGKFEDALSYYESAILYNFTDLIIDFRVEQVQKKIVKPIIKDQKLHDLEHKLNYATLKVGNDNWAKTVMVADELLEYKYDHPDAYYERARALAQLGKYKEAINSYELAIKYDYASKNKYSQGEYLIGHLYYDMAQSLDADGQLEEALKYYDLGIECGLDDRHIGHARQAVLMKLGRL